MKRINYFSITLPCIFFLLLISSSSPAQAQDSKVTLSFTHNDAGARVLQSTNCEGPWFESRTIPFYQVELYPNPTAASAGLNFSFTLSESGTVFYDLFNSIGQHVRPAHSVARQAGTYRETINTQGIPPGLYLLRIGWDPYGIPLGNSTRTKTYKILITK